MMKSSVDETLEFLRQRDASERFKDKSSSLPSPSTLRAQMPSIRKSLPAKFRNAIGSESETYNEEKEEEEEEEEKKGQNEVVKISTAQMSPVKNSHDPEWINNIEYFISKVIECLFVVSVFLQLSLRQ